MNGVPVKPDERHRVIAKSFIAGASDGFSGFLKGTDRRAGLFNVEVLVNYLSSLFAVLTDTNR